LSRQQKFNQSWTHDTSEILAADLPWAKLSGQRVAITGAGGFLGGHIARALLGLNHTGRLNAPLRVVAIVRDVEKARANFADTDAPEFLQWDLNELAIPPLGDVDTIIHAASLATRGKYEEDPVGTLLPNASGTIALLEHLRNCTGPRNFLFVSSSEVYGATQSKSPLDENVLGTINPVETRSFYGVSKQFGEAASAAYARQYGISSYILRLFHTYGPGLQEGDDRVFAEFPFKACNGQDININGDGSSVRAFCYVSDTVSALFHVLLKGETILPYNIGNPDGALSVLELARLVTRLAGDAGTKIHCAGNTPGSALERNIVLPSIARLHQLGWRVKVTPEVGFKRMMEVYS